MMRIEVEKALAASTTELVSVMRTTPLSTQHITRYDEVNTDELVDNINSRLTDERDNASLISKVVAKMDSQMANKVEASDKPKKGPYRLSFQVCVHPIVH